MKLKATRAVLYQNRLYEAGEELPEYEPAMVQAWIDAGSAVRETAEKKSEPAPGSGGNTKAQPKASRTNKGTAK